MTAQPNTAPGWTAAAPTFFDELAGNNTREWWLANRARYDHDLVEPMAALAERLSGEFGHLKIRQPNRDIRFSNDKSPYKTTIAGGVEL